LTIFLMRRLQTGNILLMTCSSETTHALTDWMRRPNPASLPGEAQLAEIVAAWPWFTTARLLLARVRGGNDPCLEAALMFRPTAVMWLEAPAAADFCRRSDDEIIDAFLQKGEYRIVPQESTPEADLAPGDAEKEDDPVSEELAEIYLAQGFSERACEIYSQLSLLYPKKSIYFAEIIERINPAQAAKPES